MHPRNSVIVSNTGVSVARLIILIVFIFLIEFGVSDSPANSTNDKAVCTTHRRVTSRLESYVEQYAMRHRFTPNTYHTRINWRWVPVDTWEAIDTCCPGYEPQYLSGSRSMSCGPVCPSNCVNGACLRPNLCKCNSGYREELSNLTGHSNCVPDCPSGCLGGICSAPNTCDCKDGYFFAEDRGSCEANCTDVGGAGPGGCVENSRCVLPNTCRCNDGYNATADSSSNPDQSPTSDATTVEPFDAVFPPTFNESSVICRPVCEPKCSINAFCVAPNTCHCNHGYSPVSTQGKGDEKINNSQCTPICMSSCVNGFCDSPNKCTCHEGYRPHPSLSNVCEPICENECVNANCVRPNVCACKDGYEKLIIRTQENETTSDNKCVPVCPGECPNGHCFAPSECHCNAGYAVEFLHSNGTVMDIGNTNDNDSSLNNSSRQSCRPICEPECPNGSKCVAPHQCRSENNWRLVGCVVGTILLLALVALAIHLVRRKKIRIFDGMSGINGKTMEQLEAMESAAPLHLSDRSSSGPNAFDSLG